MGKAGIIALQRYHQLAVLGGFQAQLAFLVLVILGAQDNIKEIPAGAIHRAADHAGPGGDKVLGLYRSAITPAGTLPQGKGIHRALGGIIGGGDLPAFGRGAHCLAVFIHSGQSLVQHAQHGAGRQAAIVQGRVGIGRLARYTDGYHAGIAYRAGQIFLFSAAAYHGKHQGESQQQRYYFLHRSSSVSG